MDSGQLRRKVILVVDDDANARLIHSEWLTHAGYETFQADAGDVGLERARILRPGLILIDLKMPRVDGWALMDALRHDETTRDAALVALTIVAPGEDRRDPVRRGFDEHWVKPIAAATLLEGVRRLIGPPVP